MATGAEIDSYQGHPDLAFGSNALPAGSTNAVLDSSPAIDYWKSYAQGKYLRDKGLFDDLQKERIANQDKTCQTT